MKDKSCQIRFYGQLNDFLREKKQIRYNFAFSGKPSVKDVIESQGIPHVEVGLILANNESVDFHYHVMDGDMISVYPLFQSFDIKELQKTDTLPNIKNKFILDVHLGKLARYLRLLGFDCYYKNDFSNSEIIQMALDEERIILTHDTGLLKKAKVKYGYWIRSDKPIEQVKEVINHFDLLNEIKPYTRCMECNGAVTDVKKDEIENLLEPNTKLYYNDFCRCAGCKRIYWQGSHCEKMDKIIGFIYGK